MSHGCSAIARDDSELAVPSPVSGAKLFSPARWNDLPKTEPQESAARRQIGIEQAGIGARTAFVAIKTGEPVLQEEAGVVEIERDRVFVSDLILMLFIA